MFLTKQTYNILYLRGLTGVGKSGNTYVLPVSARSLAFLLSTRLTGVSWDAMHDVHSGHGNPDNLGY